MVQPLHLAAVDVEGLLWIVLAIIWVVIQMIGKAAAKSRRTISRPPPPRAKTAPRPVSAPPPPPPQRLPPADQSIEEFFRQLKELSEQPAPPPPQPKPPPIPTTAAKPTAAESSWRQRRRQRQEFQVQAQKVVPVRTTAQIPAVPKVPIAAHSAIPGNRRHLDSGASLGISKQAIVGLQGKSIPAQATAWMTSGTPYRNEALRRRIRGKEALRTALISRIVLGPPKAFEPPGEPAR